MQLDARGTPLTPELVIVSHYTPMLTLHSQVRRTAYAFFHLNDGGFLDIARLLSGQVRTREMRQVCAISALKGAESIIYLDDLRLLFRMRSQRWTRISELIRSSGVSLKKITGLAAAGILVTYESASQLR